MIKNIKNIPTETSVSPNRTFEVLRSNFTEALGAPRDGGIWSGGFPFDVEHVVVPAGKRNFPFHSHAAMWEFYWVLSGSGSLRTEAGSKPIVKGDFFVCRPNDAHQLVASPEEPLEYVVISDNVPADVIHYPDSKKWNAKPGRRIFRETLDYYDGEEA